MRVLLASVLLGLLPGADACAAAGAQVPPEPGAPWRVDGQVVRGTAAGTNPVGGVWVTLHRVGSDHAGPVDSMRTTAAGRYRFTYRLTGAPEAIYFVSASYGGIAYFSPPLRHAAVSGDDALITVFDTTSGQVALRVAGRHLVVGSPHPSGRRPVGEVFELQNDSLVTVIARDTIPIWETRIPAGVNGFEVTASGDIAPGAVSREGERVGVFAPFSPGIRQLAFTYDLPRDAVPLRVPVQADIELLEVLVQEPGAVVAGAGLTEVAPVQAEGRMFRRFLAHSVPAGAEITMDLPVALGESRAGIMIAVVTLIIALMAAALIVARGRRRPVSASALAAGPMLAAAAAEHPDALIRAIADLDAEFEAQPAPDASARARYEARRAELKARLSALLAGANRPA